MNTGKTGFAGLWLELVPLKYETEECAVVTNVRTLEEADRVVTDIERCRKLVFGDEEFIETGGTEEEPPDIPRETPVWWHFDECSTHLDARTNAHEVSQQYLPLAKRFAKGSVDAVHLGHSGMDLSMYMRRSQVATAFMFKTELKTAEMYDRMVDERGVDLTYVIEGLC